MSRQETITSFAKVIQEMVALKLIITEDKNLFFHKKLELMSIVDCNLQTIYLKLVELGISENEIAGEIEFLFGDVSQTIN